MEKRARGSLTQSGPGEGLVSARGAVTRGSLPWWGAERAFSNELLVTILWLQSCYAESCTEWLINMTLRGMVQVQRPVQRLRRES